MHIRNDPSFFLTNKTGALQGEELGLIKPFLITTVIVSQSVAVSFKVALSSALKATIALLIIVVVATVVVVLLRVVVVVVVGWQAGFYSPWSHGQPLLQLLHLGGQGPS
ncbi:hypothetical protein Tco_0773804 [Tanacetum coccineum]|uniref:Uncharacterized protein n=1 Tax=Tanacetum coccineum TaxID=301880 RepID=A0ABQ4ZLQ8_9ASTR